MVKRNICGVMGVHFSSRLSETHPVKHPSIIPACKCIKVMRNYPSHTLKAGAPPLPAALQRATSGRENDLKADGNGGAARRPRDCVPRARSSPEDVFPAPGLAWLLQCP